MENKKKEKLLNICAYNNLLYNFTMCKHKNNNYLYKNIILILIYTLFLNIQLSKSANSSNLIEHIDSSALCLAATTFDNFEDHNPLLIWEKNEKFIFWKQLALTRNLDCGVGNRLKSLPKNMDFRKPGLKNYANLYGIDISKRSVYDDGPICSIDKEYCHGQNIVKNKFIFLGEYKYNKFNKGKIYFKNNLKISGFFLDNKLHMMGSILIYPSGQIYMDGLGTPYEKSSIRSIIKMGSKYPRKFSTPYQRNGSVKGILFENTGHAKKINFNKPYCYKKKMECAGLRIFKNKIFVGGFGREKFDDKGLLYSNKKLFNGSFLLGKLLNKGKNGSKNTINNIKDFDKKNNENKDIVKLESKSNDLFKTNIVPNEIDKLKREAIEEKQKRQDLEKQLAQLKKQKEQKPKPIVETESKSEFPNKPINVNFKSINKRPNDIAVIIGNANYKKQGKDIPNVNPAYADAEGFKKYFTQALGIKEGNIIYLKDATGSQLLSVFGNINSHKARLYNWVKPQVSNVYVYYAGHGVPGGDKGNAYLVPTDADSQTIQFSGYPLSTLYSNLGKIPAKSITVILEACFSGASQAGSLFSKSSPIMITAKKTMIPKNVKVITAGAVDQMASWEKDNSHGLFTKYFLKAMSGEGDKNKDGKVSDAELKDYLSDTMTYYARRYYGRDQNVQIMQGN